jgi:hypothetical protein
VASLDPLLTASAVDLAPRIRSREVSSHDVVLAHVERVRVALRVASGTRCSTDRGVTVLDDGRAWRQLREEHPAAFYADLRTSAAALRADSFALDVQGQLFTLGDGEGPRVDREHPFTPRRNVRSAVEAYSEGFDGSVPSRLR